MKRITNTFNNKENKTNFALGPVIPESILGKLTLFSESAEEVEQIEQVQIEVTAPEDVAVEHAPVDPFSLDGLKEQQTDLGSFMQRPVRIASFDLLDFPTRYNFKEFKPFTDLLQSTYIKEKRSNFLYFRGDIRLKFLTQAEPKTFGLLMASYNPQLQGAATTPTLISVTQQSMRQNVIIDTNNSSTAEMIVPFIYPYNWCRMNSNQTDLLGDVTLSTLTGITNIEGVPSTGTVQVFASFENIHLQGNTLLSESAETSSQNVQPMRQQILGNTANIDATDSTQLLAFTSQAGVSQDTSIVSSAKDMNNVHNFKTQEWFLGSYDWSPTMDSGNIVQSFGVTPFLSSFLATAANVRNHQLGPPAALALPFKFWRGSMKLHFKVACSNFHKGMLRVAYDPQILNPNSFSATGADPTYSVGYNQIVDISKEKEFTVTIGWHKNTPFRHCPPLALMEPLDYPSFVGTLRPAWEKYCNGSITLNVGVPLSVSDGSVTPVTVSVFASACDDFEVMCPTTFGSPLGQLSTVIDTPSVLLVEDESHTKFPKLYSESFDQKPAGSSENTVRNYDIGSPCEGDTTSYFSSEKIEKLTDYLRRNLEVAEFGVTQVQIPTWYARINSSATLFDFWRCSFVGQRGSMRYKYLMKHVASSTPPFGNGSVGRENGHVWSGKAFCATHINPTLEVTFPYYMEERFLKNVFQYSPPIDEETSYKYHSCQVPTNTTAVEYRSVGSDYSLQHFVNVPALQYVHAIPAMSSVDTPNSKQVASTLKRV